MRFWGSTVFVQRNRMRAAWRNGVVQSQYDYNAKGERVCKYQGTLDQARYMYTESGPLLSEETISGTLTTTTDLVWLDGTGSDAGGGRPDASGTISAACRSRASGLPGG